MDFTQYRLQVLSELVDRIITLGVIALIACFLIVSVLVTIEIFKILFIEMNQKKDLFHGLMSKNDKSV